MPASISRPSPHCCRSRAGHSVHQLGRSGEAAAHPDFNVNVQYGLGDQKPELAQNFFTALLRGVREIIATPITAGLAGLSF